MFTGKISKMINGYEFVTNTSLSLAEKYITWILFNYYAATSNHPGQDWFIIHVKLGHSMDNGFIFKKINKN